MAIVKSLTANGSKGHHRFTLRVSEDNTIDNSSYLSYSFQISPIQNGYDWYGWGSSISYSITIGDNIYTGTIPAYNGTSTVTLKSGSNIEIPHNSDGKKTINIGFSVSDVSGVNYTCGSASSSDTMALSDLHKAPDIATCIITNENNSQLTNLGLATGIIAQYLSIKDFTITTTTYDEATITNYSIYHDNVLIGTSSSNVIEVDFSNVSELRTVLYEGTYYVGLTVIVTDSKGGQGTTILNFPVIKYTRPTIEITSTNIKRKTGGGTTLTDSVAVLNFVGTCYKGDDVIGNANIPQVQYKIWNTTEPSYSNVPSTTTASVTVTDYAINDISYLKSWDYKIKISDTFIDVDNDSYIKIGNVSTGISVWSEYKDRVNFLKATKDNKELLPNIYSSSEVIIGYDDNDEPRYRKLIDFGTLPDGSITKSVAHGISNLDMIKKIEAVGYDSNSSMWFPIPFAPTIYMYNNTSCSIRIDDTNINIYSSNDWSDYTAEVILEYTKTIN